MHHLIPTVILVPISFWFLAKRRSPKFAFYQLCSLPIGLYVIAFLTEKLFGYGHAAHALFHFSYDTSYILTLVGLMLVLFFVLRRERPFGLAFAILISVAPLIELLFN